MRLNSCADVECEHYTGDGQDCDVPSVQCPLAQAQEDRMLDQMEREISRLETDYTGKYRRGF
ncbi:MAG: hypothetical protein ACOC53_07945 [Candidatus Saliniplasma sp.]